MTPSEHSRVAVAIYSALLERTELDDYPNGIVGVIASKVADALLAAGYINRQGSAKPQVRERVRARDR